jgi:RNA polymerase subunit RPABC4/transcription elongation factor Spt4
MKCPSCDREMPSDAKFCPYCRGNNQLNNASNKQQKNPSNNPNNMEPTMKCLFCDREVPSDSKFCPYCRRTVGGVYWEYRLLRDVHMDNIESILSMECREGWEMSSIVPQTITSTQIETKIETKTESREKEGPTTSYTFNYETFNLLLRRIGT